MLGKKVAAGHGVRSKVFMRCVPGSVVGSVRNKRAHITKTNIRPYVMKTAYPNKGLTWNFTTAMW